MKESFDLSSFSFSTQSPLTVLSSIREQPFFENEIVKNVVQFFEETQSSYIKQPLAMSSKRFGSFKTISSNACWGDIDVWYCHIANPYFVLQESGHDLYFGFAHQQDRKINQYTHTFLHSFVVSESGILRDPHTEAHLDQQHYFWQKHLKEKPREINSFEEWLTKDKQRFPERSTIDSKTEEFLYKRYRENEEQENQSLQRIQNHGPRLVLEDFSYYFGTKIPINIVKSIFESPPRYPDSIGNLWGYLKNKIFNDKRKTASFIDIVNNDGIGWKLQQ